MYNGDPDKFLDGNFVISSCSTCGGNCGQCGVSGVPFHLDCSTRHEKEEPCPEPKFTRLLTAEQEAFR